jgi:UDP-N-acetyl-D-mannosaminuronate dehydrogenase
VQRVLKSGKEAIGGALKPELTVIVGMGEVGKPLALILGRAYRCCEVDLAPVEISEPCEVLHICYPFQIRDFLGTTQHYIDRYNPKLTIINSTMAPGTTDAIYQACGRRPTAYSPVRGKHTRMEADMLRYRKFVAGCDQAATDAASAHFIGAGFKTATFPSARIGELSKLLETTYFGVLIGWAQEVERLAQQHGAQFADINAFIEEIDFLPAHIFPGVIGGHCVMPNIAILQQQYASKFLQAVVESNQQKIKQTKEAEPRTELCST